MNILIETDIKYFTISTTRVVDGKVKKNTVPYECGLLEDFKSPSDNSIKYWNYHGFDRKNMVFEN